MNKSVTKKTFTWCDIAINFSHQLIWRYQFLKNFVSDVELTILGVNLHNRQMA